MQNKDEHTLKYIKIVDYSDIYMQKYTSFGDNFFILSKIHM